MSAGTALDSLDIGAFPTEIQDLIFDYIVLNSSRNELKRLRKCGRYFRDRADIYLFRTLHISASIKSFERLKNVSDNDHLSFHVHELVFHRGTFSGHRMVKGGAHICARNYEDFEGWMVRARGATKDLMRIGACYEAFVEEVQSEDLFNRRLTWQDEMRKACQKFPKLGKLTTLHFAHDLYSDYLQNRCGLVHQSCTPNYFAPYEILQACGKDFRPKALSFERINGEDFGSIMTGWELRKGEADAVKNKFRQLVKLQLSFGETITNLEVQGTWDQFIAACTNIKSLTLNLDQFYSSNKGPRDEQNFARRLLAIMMKQTFRSLKHLSLRFAIVTEHDFITFLGNHSHTLESLELDRWAMPVTKQDEPTGSIVRAFYRIGKLHMKRLVSVDLYQTFSSRADGEGWEAPARSELSDGRIRNKLQGYMTGGFNDFPFPVATADHFTKSLTAPELEELDERPAKAGMGDSSFDYFRSFSDENTRHESEGFETPRREYPAGPFGQGGEDAAWQ